MDTINNNEILEYCAKNINFMWASTIVGILLKCDFRDAKQELSKLGYDVGSK